MARKSKSEKELHIKYLLEHNPSLTPTQIQNQLKGTEWAMRRQDIQGIVRETLNKEKRGMKFQEREFQKRRYSYTAEIKVYQKGKDVEKVFRTLATDTKYTNKKKLESAFRNQFMNELKGNVNAERYTAIIATGRITKINVKIITNKTFIRTE